MMESSVKANTSEEDLYGDLDEMFLSQSDGEAIQTSEGGLLSTSQSVASTTFQSDSEYSKSDTMVEDVNDLDLYDDLLVEEGQQRIESLQEIIKKYEEALNLKNKLEAENQALRELVSKKDSATKDMQKNFSSLLITAKGEISRKDRELNSLRRRLSGSPVSALAKYRIPRKSHQDVSSSLESDFDPLYVSSPGRQRPCVKSSSGMELKGFDTLSRLERSSVDSRKKHHVDNSDGNRSRVDSLDEEEPSKAQKRSKINKGRRSTETYNAKMEGKSDIVNANQDERCEKSRGNTSNELIDEVDKCELSSIKGSGKDMKRIDLREKLRQKRLEKQSCHNADTKESTAEQNSVEISLMRETNSRDDRNFIKLKRIEGILGTDDPCLSFFQSKEKRKQKQFKESGDLAAEKKFLEKLKTTVKRNESSSPYYTKNVMCSDKVINSVAEIKTQYNSEREIRSYSDITLDMSDTESIINTEKLANDEYFSATSSESYYSASDYPCNKSTPKTKLQSKDKKTSIEMSENDLSIENSTKRTFVKHLGRVEADSNLTENKEKQDIQGCEKKVVNGKDLEIDHIKHDSNVKNSSLLKESEQGRENSQAEECIFKANVDRCNKANTCKEGELINTESDSKKIQNSSYCNEEMEINKKCFKKDIENDKPEPLRRSARLSSKSDSTVSLCKSTINTQNGGKAKKPVQNENIDSVSKEELDMARMISSGNKKSVDTRKRKRRIRRSVTSETISSVTLVDLSESFSSVSEEIDDSSQSTENTSTSDDFQNLDKNEKTQKWICTNRNCTIRMRHLHPKCIEPNLIGEKNKKGSPEVISKGTVSQEDISKGKNANQNETLPSIASDKIEVNVSEFKILEGNSLSSEGKVKSQNVEPELVKENSTLNVSNGTVELAKDGSDSSGSRSSYSSESEQSSEGSRSLSVSSASSESSSESYLETVNPDNRVMTVEADKEHIKKSPMQQTKITQMAASSIQEHSSKPGVSKESDSQSKKSEVDIGKGKNSSTSLPEKTENHNNHDYENSKIEGDKPKPKSSLSMDNEIQGKNEKENHNKKQNEVGREEVMYISEKKTKAKDDISDKSRTENNTRSDSCKGALPSKDKKVYKSDINSNISAKDNIQFEKEATDLTECYKQDNFGMIKNTVSTRKDTVVETNAPYDGNCTLNIDFVDKCNKSSSSDANTHEVSNVFKCIDQVVETVIQESNESALQHLEKCDVKDDKEALTKHEISESESEGSFGSNIMSERTGSSLTEEESDFSDSDNSITGSSYTSESSYSSSDESGSGSSWDSSSSYSDSEYDGDTEVKAHPESKPNAPIKRKQLVFNTSSQGKICVKETRSAGEDFTPTLFISIDDTGELIERSPLGKHNIEIADENQQKDGSVHHGENEMEIDEEISNVCQKQKNNIFKNVCHNENTVMDENIPEKNSSLAKCSKNVSPKRSNLLQTLLKCVQMDLNVKEPVTDINKGEGKIEKFLIPSAKNGDSTRTSEELLADKAVVNSYENCSHEEKLTAEKIAVAVESCGHVIQTKSAKMSEIDLCDKNERHGSGMLQLDARENTKKDKSSKSVSADYEKGKSCNKAEKPYQNVVVSSEDVTQTASKEKDEKSSDKFKEVIYSCSKERGQNLNEISKENIFGSTSSLSDTDSDDSSSWSGSHSSDCSTCLSDSGSTADIRPAIPAESEKYLCQRSKTIGDANVKSLKSKCEKLKKTQEVDIPINCEAVECKDAANEVSCERITTLVNNTGGETLSLKPCEDNPYWIADEIPEFLSATDKENQNKKSPFLNSTSSGDTKPLTPAVKFVKLSPSQIHAVSPDKRGSLCPNIGNDGKYASDVGGQIGVISSVIDTSNLSELSESGKPNSGEKSKRSEQINTTNPRNEENSAPGSSKDSLNHGKNTLARNSKETTVVKTNNTNKHKGSDGKGRQSKLSNRRMENESITDPLCSQNLRKEISEEMKLKSKGAITEETKLKKLEKCPLRTSPRKKPSNTSVIDLKTKEKSNMEEVKLKKLEKCSLRRSPRKKSSNTSVTDLKAKGKGNEENEKEKYMPKLQNSNSSSSKTGKTSLNVKSFKSAERIDNLKSAKTAHLSKSSDDVSRTKEKSSKQSSSAGQKEKFTGSKFNMKTKEISKCKENNKNESMKSSKDTSTKIMECEQAETRKGTSMLLDISKAKYEVSCIKNSCEDKAVSLGKISIRDTTKILSERIMKLKVEKNLLEKELEEKQRQEHVPLKMKIALPTTSEVKSNDTKENRLKGHVLKSGSSRSGKSKPLTVALASNGSEHLRSKSLNKHTGSLNKYETLTFEEKLTSDEGYLSKSKSADKVSKKNHKSVSLIPQTASLKAFTIPKVTKGKQSSGQSKNDKARSETSAQKSTDQSSVIKEKRCSQSTYIKEQKKGYSKSDDRQKKHLSKQYISSSDSESSDTNSDSKSDSRSSEEDNDALVKAVFGSSNSSGNSGKSLTLEDLCKTRSSEDTDDIVRDGRDADTRNSSGVKEIRENERTLSKECGEKTKLKSTNSQNNSKCFNQPQKTRSGKHTSGSKSFDVKRKHSREGVESSNTDKVHSVGTYKSTSEKQGHSLMSASSTNGERCLRKSPRIQALESPLKSLQHQKECHDLNYKEAHLKESKRLYRTPKKFDQEIAVCENRNEARYFELSNKNPVLNKIISPKKPKHLSQPENEEILTKKANNVLSESNESEKQTRKEAKSIPLLLLEECTMDGIDYHDDVIDDTACGNSTGEAESEYSSEEDLNNKERFMNKITDSYSDQSVEEGEVSESDEENATNKSGHDSFKGTNQTCNKMTPSKFKMSSKDRLSPVKFPSDDSRYCRDSVCKCAQPTCIHKRLGLSDMKQTKRNRSDSDSCSDSSAVRPKRRMKHNHSSTGKHSRSSDKEDRRNRRWDRVLGRSSKRSDSPKNRLRSGSKSPRRCRKHSRSRSTSPLRRRRSKSCSHDRSRRLGKDYRRARSRHRYRDDADCSSPRRCRRNRSYSGDTSASTDRSHRGRNRRSMNTSETAEKSTNRSYLKKTKSNNDNKSGSENKRIETLKEKCLSGASAGYDSCDEENERYSKLKSEKCTGKHIDLESVRRAVRDRDRYHCRRNKSYSLDKRFRSRSRSPSRKRKRYVSESESDTDLDTKMKRDCRQRESKSPRKQRHKRSKTDRYSKDNV